VAAEGEQLLAGIRVPDHHGLVAAGAGQTAAVRTERQGRDGTGVSWEPRGGLARFGGASLIDLNDARQGRWIVFGNGNPLPIGTEGRRIPAPPEHLTHELPRV